MCIFAEKLNHYAKEIITAPTATDLEKDAMLAWKLASKKAWKPDWNKKSMQLSNVWNLNGFDIATIAIATDMSEEDVMRFLQTK